MDMWFRSISTLVVVAVLAAATGCASTNKRVQNDWQQIRVNHAIQARFDEAVALLRDEHVDEAIVLLEKIIAQEQRLPAPYVNLGMAYSSKGEYSRAEEHFNKALAIDPGHAKANNELGLLLRKKGRFADAKQVYERGLVQNPDYLPSIKNLGILCEIYLRNLSCALNQYKQYQVYVPDDKEVNMWVTDLSARVER